MAERPHLLLDHRAGWRAAVLAPTLGVDPSGRLALRHRPGSGRPLADAAGSFGGLARPTGLAVDAAGRIYVLDREAHLVQRYDPCLCRFEELSCLGGPGSGPRQLCDPRGLAISCAGDLWIADSGNRRLQVFSLKGLALRRIVGPYRVRRNHGEVHLEPAAPAAGALAEECGPPAEPRFPEGTWRPWDLAFDGDGSLWVSDPDNGLVHRFGPRGAWYGALALAGGEPLVRPTHLAVDGDGRLYVVQEGREEVAVYDREGGFVGHVERAHQVAGRFCPTAVAVDAEGTLYVSCAGGGGRGGAASTDASVRN